MDIDEVDETLPPIDDQDQPPLTQTENPTPPTEKDRKTRARNRVRPTIINASSTGKTKGKGSSIWDHFTKEDPPPPLIDPNEESPPPKCICNYCGSHFLCDTRKHGTSHLWNHFKKVYELSPFKIDEEKQKTLSFQHVKGGKEGETSLVAVAYNKEACRVSLTQYIVLDEFPFRHVEGEGFKRFVKTLQPRFEIPSRMTVSRDVLKLYKEEKKIIINFCQVVDHKGETIGHEIELCLLDWGISKLFTITVDNASSNDVAIRYLRKQFKEKEKCLIFYGKFLYMRSCAHIVNLMVTEGLKEKHGSIAAIRNVVRFVRSSPARLNFFKERVMQERIECKWLLCLDVPTRWNSTYLTLICAIKFRKAFDRMQIDANYMKYFDEVDKDGKPKEGPPTVDDWDIALELYDLAVDDDEHELLRTMAMNMKLKYDKYWGKLDNCNEALLIAFVLDPRYKLDYLSHCFSATYDVMTCKEMVKRVEKTIQAMFDQYNKTTSSLHPSASMTHQQSTSIVSASSTFVMLVSG
ncbi:zinc finger BED domain-containing protein RICESLEEPER 2-like [Humulus lupulus]|uniref:zinc finger BED domain-containing protein RICESLEEPER 2-like n=1 Tax=Humulus lupulus TaxID=3486 RepID=UPI002B40CEFF|nr:zinc finger BED domain-containing protein RICESLEEPER 2-like [Humulus lupulus]